jgi:aspartate racemase
VASRYLGEVRAVQSEGPYLLGGVCAGGVVAFEMAQQLNAEGQKVSLLTLVDASLPRRLRGPYWLYMLRRRLRRQLGEFLNLGLADKGRYIVERMKARWGGRSGKDAGADWAKAHRRRLLGESLLAQMRYAPRTYEGKMTLILARDTPVGPGEDRRLLLGDLAAGGTETYWVPGNHERAFTEPHVRVLAARLRACLDEAQTP